MLPCQGPPRGGQGGHESCVPGTGRRRRAAPGVDRAWGQEQVNIVIVDDQTSARTMLRHILEDISPELEVLDFSEPQEALRWCESNRPRSAERRVGNGGK